MKHLLLAVLFVLLCSVVALAQTNHIAPVENSVVQVVILLPDGKTEAHGTAFFVRPTIVATASHVYWQAGSALAEKRGSGIFIRKSAALGKDFLIPVELVANDPMYDLVLLRFDPAKIHAVWPEFEVKPLDISEDIPLMGDEIFTIGYFGQDKSPIASKGVVAGILPVQQVPISEMLMNMTINPGQSGSPVVTQGGQVVGVTLGFIPLTLQQGVQSQSGITRASLSLRLKLLAVDAH